MAPVSFEHDTVELTELYERTSAERQFKAGTMLIGEVGIRSGARVLDVGCGTGQLAEHVASLVGPNGHVHAVDPLPLRIERAQSKATANLSFAVDDACGLQGCASSSFDVAYMNAVFHWLSDKRAALRSVHRVLENGGKIGIATVSRDHPTRIQEIALRVLSDPPYDAYRPTQNAALQAIGAHELAQLLHETGFEVLSIRVVPNSTVHASAEAAFQHAQASAFGNMLTQLPQDLRERAHRQILTDLEPFVTHEGLRHGGSRIVAVATKVARGGT